MIGTIAHTPAKRTILFTHIWMHIIWCLLYISNYLINASSMCNSFYYHSSGSSNVAYSRPGSSSQHHININLLPAKMRATYISERVYVCVYMCCLRTIRIHYTIASIGCWWCDRDGKSATWNQHNMEYVLMSSGDRMRSTNVSSGCGIIVLEWIDLERS